MGRKKYQDQGMMMQQREQKQQQQQQEQPEVQKNQERQFNKGGGGGGSPFFAFGATIQSTSMECKPDPQDPTRQICKQVSSTQKFNPKTGQFDQSTKQSEYSPENRLSNFGGSGSFFGNRRPFGGADDGADPWKSNNTYNQSSQQSRPIINNQQEKPPSFVSSVMNGFRSFKNQMSNWWNSSSGSQSSSKGFIQSPSNFSHQSSNIQQNINYSSPSSDPHPFNHRHDPFEQFEKAFLSGKSVFGNKIFGDFFEDDIFNRNEQNHNKPRRKDYDNPIEFFMEQMQKNDPFFDIVKSDNEFGDKTKYAYFKRNGGAEQFTHQELKKAFEQRQRAGGVGEEGATQDQNAQSNEPEELVKQQTQYRSKNNSKIYDV